MICLAFILKFWRECMIVLLAFLLVVCLSLLSHRNLQIQQQKLDHASYVQKQTQTYLDAVQQQQIKMNKVSADYEKLKAEQAAKVEYITRTINKYIDRPVYRNVCIDDDGRLQLNELIKSGQTNKANSK